MEPLAAKEPRHGREGQACKKEKNTSSCVDQGGQLRNLRLIRRARLQSPRLRAAMKRTAGALRQQALKFGIPLGRHR